MQTHWRRSEPVWCPQCSSESGYRKPRSSPECVEWCRIYSVLTGQRPKRMHQTRVWLIKVGMARIRIDAMNSRWTCAVFRFVWFNKLSGIHHQSTGESDRQMTWVCFGSEKSKEYDENIRNERRGTLNGRQLVWNIMRWFGGFLDKRIRSDPQKPGIGLHRIKF
jgi:hypothetical protein